MSMPMPMPTAHAPSAAAVVLLLLSLTVSSSSSSICQADSERLAAAAVYAKAMQPTLSPVHLQDLPGFTRSVFARDHAFIAPESQVFNALSGWSNTQGAFLITPAIGSHFTMYIARMEGSSSSSSPLPGVERFVFVVEGAITLNTHLNKRTQLSVNGFAYVPPNASHTLESTTSATLIVFERRYFPIAEDLHPELLFGNVETQPLLETPGEVFELRKLLPANPIYDFNIHVMDFQPGEYLNVKEVHYFQHGLLLLEGQGIYRLGDKWYPIQAGDAIWMSPFVPQWYAALGRTKSRYILYKDVNRDPILHPYS